jgi:hypothetical protein
MVRFLYNRVSMHEAAELERIDRHALDGGLNLWAASSQSD